MDSLNFSKGYSKVVDGQPPSGTSSPPRNSTTAVSIFLILFLTMVIGAMIGDLIHETYVEPPESPPLTTDTIRAVCSVTQYPDSCFGAISNNSGALYDSDPEPIFCLSLRLAVIELGGLSLLPKSLISKSNDGRTLSALKDCDSLFDDALSRLSESERAVEVGPKEEMLTKKMIADLNMWISAAMTDLETCLDGLEEMGSTVLDEVRAKAQRSKEYTSISLAILSNIDALLQKFHLTIH